MSDSVSVLLVTDLPFWRRRTGAEQRIHALARFANTPPLQLHVFYLGDESFLPVAGECDALAIRSLRRTKRAWPWRSSGARWTGPGRATDRAGSAIASAASPSPIRSGPLRLEDYRWPHAIRVFRRLVRRLRPTWIVFEYVTMAYLAENLRAQPMRGIDPPRLCLDSHDLLHRRYQQFQEAGFPHWLAISAEEERRAIQSFDLVIAIQPDEAIWFRQHLPTAEVVVAGHAVDFDEIAVAPPGGGTEFVVGYFGSNNGSNVDAVLSFAADVWPKVRANCPQATWLIAGTVLDDPRVAGLVGARQVRGERTVGRIADFYAQVDVVINPVRFGTGLKIKNVEALAYGRPVVTTPAGKAGIPATFGKSLEAAADPQAFSHWLIELAQSPALRVGLSRQAEQVARQELVDSVVFRELSHVWYRKP